MPAGADPVALEALPMRLNRDAASCLHFALSPDNADGDYNRHNFTKFLELQQQTGSLPPNPFSLKIYRSAEFYFCQTRRL